MHVNAAKGFPRPNKKVGRIETGSEVYLNPLGKRFAILYFDANLPRTEIFEIRPDGWQDRVETRVFKSVAGARASLRKLGFGLSDESRTEALFGESAMRDQGVDPALLQMSIWPITQQWDAAWEAKFTEWVQNNVDDKFFLTNKIYTDCADVAYALRWIFARISGLPAAGTLMGSGRSFSSFDMRDEWKNLPTHADWTKDQRFRKVLAYILRNTYTHTLMKDSYPVKMDLEGFSPGSYHLGLHSSSGHTQVIYRGPSRSTGLPFMMFSSTLPGAVRQLQVHFYWGSAPVAKENGFLRMRWAQGTSRANLKILEQTQHPFYSMEQYELEVDEKQGFVISMIKKLDPEFEIVRVVQNIFGDLEKMLVERVKIVDDGYAYCSNNSCEPGSGGHESWSTPSRDARLVQQLTDASLVIGMCFECGPLVSAFRQKLIAVDAHSYPVDQLLYALTFGFTSSDPRVDPAARWGMNFEVLVSTLKTSLIAKIAEREKKVSTAKESHAEDFAISNVLKGFDTYANLFGEELNAKFQALLSQSFIRVNGQETSLAQIKGDHIFWIANADATRDERWTTASQTPYSLIPSFRGSMRILEGPLVWMGTQKNLYDLKTKSYIDAPAGAEWLQFSSNSDHALITRSGSVLFLDRKTSHESLLEGLEPARIERVYFESDKIVVHMNKKSQMLVYRKSSLETQSSAQPVSSIDLYSTGSEDKPSGLTSSIQAGSFLAFSNEQIWNYLDHNLAWHPIVLEGAFLGQSVSILRHDEKFVLLAETEGEAPRTFLVRKATGAIERYPLDGIYDVRSNMRVAMSYKDDAHTVHVLSEDLSRVTHTFGFQGQKHYLMTIDLNATTIWEHEKKRVLLVDFSAPTMKVLKTWEKVWTVQETGLGMMSIGMGDPSSVETRYFELWNYSDPNNISFEGKFPAGMYIEVVSRTAPPVPMWFIGYRPSELSDDPLRGSQLFCRLGTKKTPTMTGVRGYFFNYLRNNLEDHPLLTISSPEVEVFTPAVGAVVSKGGRSIWLDNELCR